MLEFSYSRNMPRSVRQVHLPIELPIPESRRLVDALIAEITQGRLADGDWVPSTRALAHQLGCSRTLVDTAYTELGAAGYLESVPGSGTRVAVGTARAVSTTVSSTPAPHNPHHQHQLKQTKRPRHLGDRADSQHSADAHDLRPGRPDVDLIDPRAWARSLKAAARASLTIGSPRDIGNPGFTSAMASHLRRHRGISVDSLIPTPGSAHAFHAIAQVARVRGLSRCYVESPCYGAAFEELDRAGLEIVPIGVDSDGLKVDDLPAEPGLVYVTPAHQYPLGQRMSVPRRAALIDWAGATDSLIIEDDYDGEFRFGVPPLPALRSMTGAADRVVYVGTSSKIISPGLALAWIVPPAHLFPDLANFVWERRLVVNATIAEALADFIERGELARHLARAGRVYRDRRAALVQALGEECPEAMVLGVEAGLHVCVNVDNDAEVVARLADRGWLVAALSTYPAQPASTDQATLSVQAALPGQTVMSGLVIGFATLTPARAREFARDLAAVLRSS